MRISTAIGLRLFSAMLVIVCVSANVLAIEATWIGGPAGSWMEGTNWSTGVVPGGTLTNVTIDSNPAASSAVSLPATASSISIGAVTIDAGDQLGIESGATLTSNFVTVDGDLILNAAAGLRIVDYLWVQPNGHVSMTDNLSQTGSLVQSSGSTGAYWNQGRISGAGAIGIGLPMFNEGIIVGDLTGEILSAHIQGSSTSNIGEMLATDGGTLLIRPSGSSAALYNSESGDDGLIQARGANALVRIENVTVTGGEISTAADENGVHGLVRINSATLRNLKLAGNVKGSSMTLEGTIQNTTNVSQIDPSTGTFASFLAPTLLTGGGRFEIGRGSISGNSRLINDVDHTIAGAGSINLKFINRGLVEAHPEPGDSGFFIGIDDIFKSANSGRIVVRDGAELVLSGDHPTLCVLENFEGNDDGLIEADANSTIRLNGLTLRGGVLRSNAAITEGADSAGRIVTFSNTVTLRDIKLEGTIGDETSEFRITDDIENTGVLRALELRVESTTTLKGGGVVHLGQGTSNRIIEGGENPSLLINEDNTIKGTGAIYLFGYTFKNRGTILAESFSPQLLISGANASIGQGFYNSGLVKAANGATINISSSVTNFEDSQQGIIHADDQSFVRVSSVQGGIFSTAGSGEILAGNVSTPSVLRDIYNQGFLRFTGTTEFAGTVRNDGTIVHNGSSIVRFTGAISRLTGSGTYAPQSAPLSIAVGQFSSTMFIHGPDHTIRGKGAISVLNGGFINEGTVIAEGNGSVNITMANGTIMRQQGTLNALELSHLDIKTSSVKFTNEGTMVADGHVTVLQQLSQPLDVINASGATVRGLGTFHLAAPDSNPLNFLNEVGGTITGGLSFNFDGVSDLQPRLFRNSGLISPNGFTESFGRFSTNASFVQDTTGTLEFDLAGQASTGWYDALKVSYADITLAGTLKVWLSQDFHPSLGDTYPLLSAEQGVINGTFDTFIPTPMAGKWMSLEYQANQVLLHINAITADFDGNGFVDGDDLDDWQLASQGGTAAGDADGDGDSDGRDFLAWQRQFGAGIDLLATSVAVPEPAGLVMMFTGLLGLAMRRKGTA